MKSLSITVLVSVVLLAAGLIVIYKTPAPEAEDVRLVLRIDNSQRPDADMSAAEAPQPEQAAPESETAAASSRGGEGPGQSEPPQGQKPALHSDLSQNTDAQSPGGPGGGDPVSPWDALPRQAEPQSDPSLGAGHGITGSENAKLPEAPGEPAAPDDRSASYADPYATPDHPPQGGAANAGPVGQTAALTAPEDPTPPPQTAAAEPGLPFAALPPPSLTGADALSSAAAPSEPPELPQRNPEGWKAVTASEGGDANSAAAVRPNLPPPPLPKRRVDHQPPIARDPSADSLADTRSIRTTDEEQRNAMDVAAANAAPPAVGPAAASPAARLGGPRIAIIIRDAGANEQDTYAAITSLKPEITIALSPYARNAKIWARKAKDAGHEVFLGVPMEPAGGEPGADSPHMLLASESAEENLKRLDRVLSQIDGYGGVINIMGGKLAQKPDALRPFMQAVKSRGLTYVDDGTAAHPFAILLAAQLQLPYRVADSRIDDDPSSSAIHKRLQELVDIAREKGSALGVASANAETVRQIILWQASLPSQRIALVPASQIVAPMQLP